MYCAQRATFSTACPGYIREGRNRNSPCRASLKIFRPPPGLSGYKLRPPSPGVISGQAWYRAAPSGRDQFKIQLRALAHPASPVSERREAAGVGGCGRVLRSSDRPVREREQLSRRVFRPARFLTSSASSLDCGRRAKLVSSFSRVGLLSFTSRWDNSYILKPPFMDGTSRCGRELKS
jgi:hypothetical protein